MYLRDPAHSSFNRSESTLTLAKVKGLSQSWNFATDGALVSGVTISGGTLYFGDWVGNFYAVNARDGRELWRHYVGMAADPPRAGCQGAIGVSSQAAVSGDVVYVGGGDSTVYAFDARSGFERWRVRLADPRTGAYLWSSITVAKNALYVGIASLGDCPLVRGAVVRIDLRDPQRPVYRHLAPEGETGAGVWSTPAVDETTNTVFVTTGTGEQDPDNALYGGSILALDAGTLEVKSYFLLPTNDVDADIEWGSSPTLIEAPDGTPLVAATAKDGFLYVFRRDDLSLAYFVPLAAGCACPECGCGSISTPAWDGAWIYVGAGAEDYETSVNRGNVYAIDPGTGMVVWRTELPGTVIAPVTVANGVLYAPTMAGLAILDSRTGEVLWSDPEQDSTFAQAVVADGVVYCANFDQRLIAWRAATAP